MTVASKVKQTLASLKGSQGTLRLYAGQTQNDETRVIYEQVMQTTGHIINDLEERLQLLEDQEPQYKGN